MSPRKVKPLPMKGRPKRFLSWEEMLAEVEEQNRINYGRLPLGLMSEKDCGCRWERIEPKLERFTPCQAHRGPTSWNEFRKSFTDWHMLNRYSKDLVAKNTKPPLPDDVLIPVIRYLDHELMELCLLPSSQTPGIETLVVTSSYPYEAHESPTNEATRRHNARIARKGFCDLADCPHRRKPTASEAPSSPGNP